MRRVVMIRLNVSFLPLRQYTLKNTYIRTGRLECPPSSRGGDLLVPQWVPVYPARHWQMYPLAPSIHRPPFRHGMLAHSLSSNKKPMIYYWSIIIVQIKEVKPRWHLCNVVLVTTYHTVNKHQAEICITLVMDHNDYLRISHIYINSSQI